MRHWIMRWELSTPVKIKMFWDALICCRSGRISKKWNTWDNKVYSEKQKLETKESDTANKKIAMVTIKYWKLNLHNDFVWSLLGARAGNECCGEMHLFQKFLTLSEIPAIKLWLKIGERNFFHYYWVKKVSEFAFLGVCLKTWDDEILPSTSVKLHTTRSFSPTENDLESVWDYANIL